MMKIDVRKYRDEITKTLEDLIAIESVKGEPSLNAPYGKGIFSALIYILEMAERLELSNENLFGHMGRVWYGNGSETLAVLTHLDVVPGGEGWDTDPFVPVIKDGCIYGRGAVDNKASVVASLFALYAIKQECITLGKKVELLFGCDEESGWGDIDYFKAHYEEPDYVISPDAAFPIFNREKGLLHTELKKRVTSDIVTRIVCGERVNIVPAKAVCELNCVPEGIFEAAQSYPGDVTVTETGNGALITVKGVASHGSAPEEGVNAGMHLIRFLRILGIKDRLTDVLYRLDDLIGLETDGETLGLRMSDGVSGPLSVNVGTVNFDGSDLSVRIDMRTPVSADINAVFEKEKEAFSGCFDDVVITHSAESHEVPEDNPMIVALRDVYREYTGREAECLCCSGATYARAFRNGVAFGPVEPGKEACEHGPNEKIEIEDVLKLTEILACAIMKICAN